MPDAAVISSVHAALQETGYRELFDVEVTAEGQAIRLCGQVPSFYLKQIAQNEAHLVAPSFRIVNEIVVAWARERSSKLPR